MKFIKLTMLALTVSAALTACGGGDTEDRLDVADPKVRFIDAIPSSPPVTLYRSEVAQPDATNVTYTFASRYFDVPLTTEPWSYRLVTAPTTPLDTPLSIDAGRGNRYSIVALPGDATSVANSLLIVDPYNKGLLDNRARVRIVNASFNSTNVDVYLTATGVDLNTVGPNFSTVQFKTAVPASGADSTYFDGGTYQLRITTAGTKTVIFNAPIQIDNNADLLLLTLPVGSLAAVLPDQIRVLEALGNDNTNGTTTEIDTQ